MSRLAARRAAVQMIYENMLGGSGGDDTLLGLIGFAAENVENADEAFLHELVDGVAANAASLDQAIAARSQARSLERIPVVNRAILRLALYELQNLPETPAAVVVNEAVELARRFGEEGDEKFVNGLLGRYLKDQQEK